MVREDSGIHISINTNIMFLKNILLRLYWKMVFHKRRLFKAKSLPCIFVQLCLDIFLWGAAYVVFKNTVEIVSVHKAGHFRNLRNGVFAGF